MTDTTTTGRKAVSYPTRRAAHDALCLDAGFDPFLHGGVEVAPGRVITRPTIAGLRALGYRVVSRDQRTP